MIYLWSYDGECLQEMNGHTAFVYCVAYIPSTQEVISGGEDRTVRVWKGGECIQTLMHTGSVWSVAALPNGDIVSACSDRIASQSSFYDNMLNYEQEYGPEMPVELLVKKTCLLMKHLYHHSLYLG